MKTKISILALVFLTVLSCNELDKLTEFDITEDFDTTLNVSIPDNSEGMEYSFEETKRACNACTGERDAGL